MDRSTGLSELLSVGPVLDLNPHQDSTLCQFNSAVRPVTLPLILIASLCQSFVGVSSISDI